MKLLISSSLVLITCLLLWGCPSGAKKAAEPIYLENTKTVAEMSTIHNKYDRFKYQIIGHFSNREEAEKSGEAVQEFIVRPIFTDRPDEFWVYLEFFSPLLIDRPLDQRIEQYTQVSRDSFAMQVYYLKEPTKYINEWRKAKPFANLDKNRDLIRDEKCDLIIAAQADKPGTYRTLPPESIICHLKDKPNGAEYVDLEYITSDEGYTMWFKFYDKNKNKMKSTADSGIRFNRLDPKADDYKDLTKE